MTIQELKHRVQAIRQYKDGGNEFWAKRRLRIQFVIELGLMGKELVYHTDGREFKTVIPSDGKKIGEFGIENHIEKLVREEFIEVECGCCGELEDIQVRDMADIGCESGVQIYCGNCNYTWQYED